VKTTVGRSRFFLLRTLVLSLIMCDTIRRMLEGTRPIDLLMLIIDALVLLLIAYDVAANICSKRRTSRRIAMIFQHIEEGQKLQAIAPNSGITDPSISAPWVESVKKWVQRTHDVLEKYSSQAAASFALDSVSVPVQYGGISSLPDVRESYRALILKMNNLRSIVEKPDMYF